MAIKTKKGQNFSDWYTEVVGEEGAQLVDIRYGIQGFIAHRPWAVSIIRNYEKMLEEEVESDGYRPMLLPVVIPRKNIEKEKEHVKGFAPEVFWVTQGGTDKLDEPWFLRPTGESQIYPMYSLWVRSHNDLPFKRYQSRICTYRYEMTTRPFLRGREFIFFETHAVYKDHKGVLNQVAKDMEISNEVIYKQLGIPFLFFKRPSWDKFAGAVDTYAADTLMPDGKVNQIASTHDLGQRFSKAYNIRFTDSDEKDKFGWQTCYGPGIWRIMAALIGIHGDDKGLILPFDVSPIQVAVVPILGKKDKEIIAYCKKLEKKLLNKFRVKYDDSDNSPGWKYNEWEMRGVPLRIEVGPKEVASKELTLVRRTDRVKIKVKEKDLEDAIIGNGGLILEQMKKTAESFFKKSMHRAKNLDELNKVLNKMKGFVKIPFCSMDKNGERCADILQEKTRGGKVRGTLYSKGEKAVGNCVVCGKKAKHIVYVAKAY